MEQRKTFSDFKEEIFIMIKQQGIAFLLMLAVTAYFYDQNAKMQEQITQQTEEVKAYYKNDHAEMRRVLERSNDVIDRNNEIFAQYLSRKK